MAKADVVNIQGEKVGEIELNDAIWATDIKPYLIHDVVLMQLTNRRRGTSSTKTRGEVRGGGRKPWRQKGTGRARAGSSTSPVWVGGGTVFGPKPKEYHMKVPKKVRRAALRSALSARYSEASVKVLDNLDLGAIGTKNFAGIMKVLSLSKPLLVVNGKNEILEKSARNIPHTKVLRVEGLNVYDVIRHEQLVVTVEAIERIQEALSS
ncbi:MAG: 50S ribosomal protein L4 [Syntrophorhabdales bacterium]|jgi:large subunit ribosomal protein L4